MQFRGSSRRLAAAVLSVSVISSLLWMGLGIGLVASPAARAAVSLSPAPSVIINEVNAVNWSGAQDEDGTFQDWAELFNTTTVPVDLTGWGLSNTAKSPFRWVFPTGTSIEAHGYLRVWLSKKDRTTSTAGLHTNFNVDAGSDQVVLTAPNLTVTGQAVDSTAPPKTKPDVSWCRMPSGSATAAFTNCLAPTPGAANAGAVAAGLLTTPTLSQPSSVYSGSFSVNAAGPAGATLRYTTDGSEPSVTSTPVTGPITVSASEVLRVGAFAAGMLPSYSQSATYVMDSTGRYAGQRQFFVTMTPADAKTFEGKGLAPASGWKSAVEMIDENGTHAFSGQASTSDSGSGGSRGSQATMPMDIKFNDAIGTSSISYPIFHQKPGLTSFKKLRLRNSGSDYAQAHIRDQYWQGVGVDAGLVGSATEPVQVFVNGHYYGMMDLREREDETLISSSLPGVDKDNVQYLSDSTVLSGENSKADYDAMVSFIAHNDMTLAANYQKAAALLDLDNLAEDYALHVFAADCDFGPHNLHMFRALDYDGRWRYRPHDFDIASSWISGPSGWCNSSPSSPNFSYSGSAPGLMIAALLKNPAFKARYANIVADQLNTALSSSALTARLDDLSVPVASYLPNQIAANGQPVSMPAWSGNIQRIRTFVTTRQPYYDKGVQSRLAIGPRKPVQLSVNDPAMGTIAVNTLDLDQFLTAANPTWTGSYYGEFPITVVAKPRPGYAFVGWQGADTSSSQTIHPTIVAGSPTYRANFAPIAAPVAPIVSSVADQTGQTGDLASLQVDAHDPNLYPLTYSAKLPNGLNINPATGLIYGKLTRGGTFPTTITVANGVAKTTIAMTWTVTNKLDRNVILPVNVTGDGPGLQGSYFAGQAPTGTPLFSRVQTPSVAPGLDLPGENLVADPGAEAGPVGSAPAGWTVMGGMTVNGYASGRLLASSPGPADRGVNYFAGGGNVVSSTASQVVDLSALSAQIDAGGLDYQLGGWLGGYVYDPDTIALSATFRDGAGAVLSGTTLGPVGAADRHNVTGLLQRTSALVAVPVGARSVSVLLTATKASTGVVNDGYADNISLVLTAH